MKTTISKVAFFVFALVLSTAGIGDEVCSNAVMLARAKLDDCLAVLPTDFTGTAEYMMEFGMCDELPSPEIELGMFVSNNVDVVYSNLSTIATNIVERRLLLASAWWLGDDYYLDCLSRNVDLAVAGTISANDLRWYMRGHRTRRLTYLLASQYDRPGVSNIVLRLMTYTGETNKYEKVLSGEAKAEYLEFEQFMADGPEAPRQME